MIFSEKRFLLLTRPDTFKLVPFNTLWNSKTFSRISTKIRATELQKGAKFVLFDNCFSEILTEVQIWYWETSKLSLGRFLER